jgi:signal transduction histidine kinase
MSAKARPSLARAPSLRSILLYGGLLVATLSVSIFTASMIAFTHIQVHKQTDALLLQLAAAEAQDLSTLEKPPPIRDIAVVLSASQNEVARRYALILDKECNVLTASSGLEKSVIPKSWCTGLEKPGEYRYLQEIPPPSTGSSLPKEMRAVVFSARSFTGDERYVFIAIDDDLVDQATWQAAKFAPPLGLLVIAAIGGVLAFFVRRLNAALSQLSKACVELGEKQTILPIEQSVEKFNVPENTPAELQSLSQTLQILIRRLGALLETQERFLAEAAHELRTPLTALQGELELALRRERSPDDYKKSLGDALTDAKRLGSLSEALLDSARARTVAVESKATSLRAQLDESLRRFERQLESKSIKVEIKGDPTDEYLAQAHALSTSRVFDNLFKNSLIHADPTHFEITFTRKEEAGNRYIELSIQDDGPGIPEELREHLFSPFQRASQAKGHGLGLYLTQLLMQRQSGQITCPKTPRGALFCLRFIAA